MFGVFLVCGEASVKGRNVTAEGPFPIRERMVRAAG